MGKRRWTNDTRIVKPVLEANGYFALNNGHNCNGSHTKFVNENGEVISVPKSINRMLWQREVRKHNIVGGMTVIGKLKSQELISMKWTELLRKDNYALLQSESDTQYAVVSCYDPTQPEGQQWAHGTYFTYFKNNPKKMLYLQSAYDCFMEKVNADFIPRCRLEELATLFKDGLITDDRESALEYFDEYCEMSEEEKSFFEIEEDSPIANTKFENPMYNKGYDDGFADGANSIDE